MWNVIPARIGYQFLIIERSSQKNRPNDNRPCRPSNAWMQRNTSAIDHKTKTKDEEVVFDVSAPPMVSLMLMLNDRRCCRCHCHYLLLLMRPESCCICMCSCHAIYCCLLKHLIHLLSTYSTDANTSTNAIYHGRSLQACFQSRSQCQC